MQATTEHHLFRRGKRGTFYLRLRIPANVRDAYPRGKTEIVGSLKTSDESVARKRLRAKLARLDEEFEKKVAQLQLKRGARQRISTLAPEQLHDLAQTWVHAVLQTDEEARANGLDEAEFAELGERIAEQRTELGAMLARGHTAPIIPALRSFLHLCGIEAKLLRGDEQRAGYTFLEAAVTALEHQSQRQAGRAVRTEEVTALAPPLVTWTEVFEKWRDYVEGRPMTTTIACATAWRQIERFARENDVLWPAHVTPTLMTALVDRMRADGLSPKTVNERLRKIRAVYTIAVGKQVLSFNPAATTLGVKLPQHLKGRKKRLPFSPTELHTIFGSPVFTAQLRSCGQSGEATYWLPLIMYYSGARPEEIAGLTVDDVREAPKLGWYLHITDLSSQDDVDLFEDSVLPRCEAPAETAERRRLKNPSSRRNIPVAQQLIELGLLRYIQWVRDQGHERLFPTLTPDTHGKLSGAFGKFFGRYKRKLGIDSNRKTLYSFRHCMKDVLERARVPRRYIQRALGHTTGDGQVTDGYGSDLPLNLVAGYFRRLRFDAIPALPWQPGSGVIRFKASESTQEETA